MDGMQSASLNTSPVLDGLVPAMGDAVAAVETYVAAAKAAAADVLLTDGKPDRTALFEHQH
ncbi:MAG: acyl-CoA dehydrogenase, partial [Pseudomonadota bacterium]